MGYSGQPMVSVTNNKRLLNQRIKLFELDCLGKSKPSPSSFNVEKFEGDSLYDKEGKLKRRKAKLAKVKKEGFLKNIISFSMLILVMYFAWYIIK